MSENLTALASENLNPSLRSLLEDVQRGHIRVPRFQRPFVWKNEQRIELLQSVRDNMPIGSLLVWRTIKFKLASFPSVGPHTIPPIAEEAPAIGWQYLLDGHQRVSTLLGLLLQPYKNKIENPSDDMDKIDWNIQYDLEDEEFIFVEKTQKRNMPRPLLPLSTLFDGRLVNKYMRDIRKKWEDNIFSDDDFNKWEERADQLSYRFQQCRIPIVIMVTDDLSLAAKTFQRINSLGTPMGEAHLVAALTWKPEFDLRERIDTLRNGLPEGWRSLEDGIFLQVCKGLSHLDMTRAGQIELVKKLADDSTLLERAGSGIKHAIELLSRLGAVVNQELLPYTFQLVFLAVELANEENVRRSEGACMNWFWRTSWSEVFGAASYRQVRAEQENLRDALNGKKIISQQWVRDQSIPNRFDARSARVRLFVLRLACRSDLFDEENSKIDGRELLMGKGRDVLTRLFPTPTKADTSTSLKKLLQGGGNRFFVSSNKEDSLRDSLLTKKRLPKAFLQSNFIDATAIRTLQNGDLESFVKMRANAMDAWDKEQWEQERNKAA